jgi:hypothetical protein
MAALATAAAAAVVAAAAAAKEEADRVQRVQEEADRVQCEEALAAAAKKEKAEQDKADLKATHEASMLHEPTPAYGYCRPDDPSEDPDLTDWR